MIINNKEYNEFKRVYFIAEIGLNHNGSIDLAKKIIKKAALCGADAVKFQKRNPEKLWTEEFLKRSYNNENSFGQTYGEHKQFLEFNNEQYFELKEFANKFEVDFLVSAFDTENLDFCVKELNVPAIKIPSPFVTHTQYLNHAIKYGLPIFLSTGMHNIEEIDCAVEILKKNKNDIVVMQCTSLYPAQDRDVNLRVLQTYKQRYNCLVGYSGHDNSVVISAIAASMGAVVIEKHFTLDRAMRGPDHASSLEQRGLDLTIKYIKSAIRCLGTNKKEVLEKEYENRTKYCYSIKAKVDIKKGELFTENNVVLKSPRNENTKNFYDLLGKKAENNYKKDEDIK